MEIRIEETSDSITKSGQKKQKKEKSPTIDKRTERRDRNSIDTLKRKSGKVG